MKSPPLADLPTPPPAFEGWPWTEESPRTGDERLPRISIVMPSLNQVDYLEAAIRSVLLQGYPDVELIVVDGGSTDGSVDVIRNYEPWVASWTSEPDNGQYDAINRGFQRSHGSVLGWLNSSDMLAPGALATIGTAFTELGDKVHWLTGVQGRWDEAGRLVPPLESQAWIASLGRAVGLVPRRRYRRQWIAAGYYEGRLLGPIQQESTFWTRTLWDRAGGHVDASLDYAADFDLWRRFAAYEPLRVVDALLAGFRVHEGQKTTTIDDYYAEVDQLRGPVAPAWIRLGQGGSRVGAAHRRLLACYLLLAGGGSITRDRAAARWVLSR